MRSSRRRLLLVDVHLAHIRNPYFEDLRQREAPPFSWHLPAVHKESERIEPRLKTVFQSVFKTRIETMQRSLDEGES